MIYVYKHIRKDTGQIFYIGIGDKSRPYNKNKRTKHWKNISKITDIDIDIVCTFDNIEEAKYCEKYLIAYYGRRDLGLGPLVNFTDGGEGVLGRLCSKETRNKISAANKGRHVGRPAPWVTKRMTGDKNVAKRPEVRKKLKDNCVMKRPEIAAKVAAALKGRKRPEISGDKCHFYGLKGENNPAFNVISRKVINIVTGETFKSQSQLAKYLGVSNASITGWINGKNNPPKDFNWKRN